MPAVSKIVYLKDLNLHVLCSFLAQIVFINAPYPEVHFYFFLILETFQESTRIYNAII